jgi:hypothetical protein
VAKLDAESTHVCRDYGKLYSRPADDWCCGSLRITPRKSALVSGVVASGFAWPGMVESSWTVKAIWYSSLILALTSICAATQQSVALYRLSSHPRGWIMIRRLLSNDPKNGSRGQLEPRLWQLYIWQIPVSLLNGSVYFFLAGLAVLLWNAGRSVNLDWAKGETKVFQKAGQTLNRPISPNTCPDCHDLHDNPWFRCL